MIYSVEGVYKQWYGGWYIAILLEKNRSHHLVFWENINCIHPVILDAIKECRKEYRLYG